MPKRVLVTGASGFSGRYMCRYLRRMEGLSITGVDVKKDVSIDVDSFVIADLTDSTMVSNIVEETKPDYVIHLAGLFGTDDINEIYRANVLSITSLLEAVRRHTPESVVVTAGSAAEYGRVSSGQIPVTEEMICEPVTSYGLSKLLATQIALHYHKIHGISVTIFRPFQLIGKGVTTQLAPGTFAEQLKQAIAQGSDVIEVGNLDSYRDFLDVLDAVECIWALCLKPAPGQIFNICSGVPMKMADLLQAMTEFCGKSIRIKINPALLRGKADVSIIYGSCQKVADHCRWQPRRTLQDSIAAMFG